MNSINKDLSEKLARLERERIESIFEAECLTDWATRFPLPRFVCAINLFGKVPYLSATYETGIRVHNAPTESEAFGNQAWKYPAEQFYADPYVLRDKFAQVFGDPLPLYYGSGTFFHLEPWRERVMSNAKYPNTTWRDAEHYFFDLHVEENKGEKIASAGVHIRSCEMRCWFQSPYKFGARPVVQDNPVLIQLHIQAPAAHFGIEAHREVLNWGYRGGRNVPTAYGKAKFSMKNDSQWRSINWDGLGRLYKVKA